MNKGSYKGEPQIGVPGHCFSAQAFGPDGEAVLTVEPTGDPAIASRISVICAEAVARQALHTSPTDARAWSPPDSFASNWLTNGAALHPHTVNLVVRFARALAAKLADAEVKYGYSDGWMSAGWADECRAQLLAHIAKGDPRDVAAYCAFLWHHSESTARSAADDVESLETGEGDAR